MADPPTQDQRVGKLATHLGKDKLVLTGFECVEAMGELFEMRVEALSPDLNINFNEILGRNASIHLETVDKIGRDFSGVVTEARVLGPRGDLYGYALTLRPWLWLLSLTSDCKIFANMDPMQIIKKVFEDREFSDVIDLTSGDYPTLEYTVQYRETDLNFVLRLMEQYGIYFYFQFAKGDGVSPSSHMLVLADSAAHVPLPDPAVVAYVPDAVGARSEFQQFHGWSKSRAIASGVYTLKDYDYRKPGDELKADAQVGHGYEHGDMEIFDFPGGYVERNRGAELAAVRLDGDIGRDRRRLATGDAPSLTPGYTIDRVSNWFERDDHDEGNYLIVRCSHSFGGQAYASGPDGGAGVFYSGAYELAKSFMAGAPGETTFSVPFRMPQTTRKPLIAGTQSALVIVADDGEEIDVDKEGRILVQFHWDRKKTPSRRVRVAQIWAGNARGAMFIPRKGDEVLVHYEEGDPDRPIVIGSVYNQDNPMSADLPDLKTVSRIKTRLSKNSEKHHLLAFQDKVDGEEVNLVVERLLDVDVRGDEKRKVSKNQTEEVDGNVTQTIGGDDTITVGGPGGGGNYTLGAEQKVTINFGPKGSPATQIVMTTSKITLNVGPGGSPTQIVMDASGITLSGPTITVKGQALVAISAAVVKINS